MNSTVKQAYNLVRNHKMQNAQKIHKAMNVFETKINELISKTPTGEERNTLTDINILYMDLKVSLEESWEAEGLSK